MSRRGAVLLAVLWISTGLGSAAALMAAMASNSVGAATNREAHMRARWAAEACLAVASHSQRVDSLDLGADVWCRVWRDSRGRRIDVNTADSALIHTAFRSLIADSVDAAFRVGLLMRARRDRGFIASLDELSAIVRRDAAALRSLFAIDEEPRVAVVVAGEKVLAALPGLSPPAAAAIIAHREAGAGFRSIGDLGNVLSPAERRDLERDQALFLRAVSFDQPAEDWIAEGHVVASPIVSKITERSRVHDGQRSVVFRSIE